MNREILIKRAIIERARTFLQLASGLLEDVAPNQADDIDKIRKELGKVIKEMFK